MSFGAIIACGKGNKTLGINLDLALIEIRVEQSLGDATTYAIRFRDDICEGKYTMSSRSELQPDQILSVLVQDGGKTYCLVRGPITQAKTSYALGGPGSFYEIHGTDGREVLTYDAKTARQAGSISDIATSLLAPHFDVTDVESGMPKLGDPGGAPGSNQNGTLLEYFRKLSGESGAFLWVTYSARYTAPGPATIIETAHFSTSPKRGFGAGSIINGPPMLVANTKTVLKGGSGTECAPNVTKFSVDEDFKSLTGATAAGVNPRSGKTEDTTAQSPDKPLDSAGKTASQLPGKPRIGQSTSANDAETNRRRAEAILSEQAWFVTAQASSSLHMLGTLVAPHDIITVDGLGPLHSMPFQVSKVTHVVTAETHMMDMELRANQRVSKGTAA